MPRFLIRITLSVVLVAVLIAPTAAQTIRKSPLGQPSSTQPAPFGRSCLIFDQRSNLSQLDEIVARLQFRPKDPAEVYDIANESFEVHLPNPRGAQAGPARSDGESTKNSGLGMIVWVSASDDGSPPKEWLPVLDRHGLIWIGANKSGNEHKVDRRFALAIDAAFNMMRNHRIDPDRVYIAGVSGGGRIASMLALLYPDLFRGGYYIVGCNYFKSLPLPEDPSRSWRATFNRPAEKWLTLARMQSRIVLLTGENDANRAQTLSTYRHGYLADGFTHVNYIEVPKMGHATPDAQWFERGIEALETVNTTPPTRPHD